MKFGKYLESKARPEWRAYYMDYKRLKDLIKTAAEEAAAAAGGLVPDFSPRTTSLTVARNGGPGGRRNAEEAFYEALEGEVAKVNKFTVGQVSALKKRLKALVVRANAAAAGRPPPVGSGRPPLPPSGGGGDVEAGGGAGSAGLSTSAPPLSFSAGTSPAGAPEPVGPLLEEAKAVGDEFLALEKYVNLNYLGFHKILKKHDKNLPHAPCQQFYVAHLHHQPWVQGNYSGLLVQLSSVYAALRGDASGTKNEDASQGFVRSTTKYWVRTADVSAVKHAILQHLPVFQYNAPPVAGSGSGGGAGPSGAGEVSDAPDPGDAQLINSTYLDNSSMELYHGRLDKRPGAIAVRVRWYGDGAPRTAFVERKTHRESWKGEESVKERFALPAGRVFPFLTGEYGAADAAADLRAAGKREEEVSKFVALFEEVAAQVDAKQLAPVLRTQYQRTAFQIPYDSSVRISLDTNLVMMKENPDDGPGCLESGRWFRDPALPVPRTEITRFPHAVLEVKLSLPEGTAAPAWVTDLLESGYLTEVHKFSKFMHGSATLLPDLVQAVPYWVDDESVRPSMLASAPVAVPGSGVRAGREACGVPAASAAAAAAAAANKPRRRAGWADEGELSHPLLGDAPTLQLLPGPGEGPGGRRPASASSTRSRLAGWVDSYFGSRAADAAAGAAAAPLPSLAGLDAPLLARTVPMRIEPKTFLANERTFLSWLHMAVTIGSIAAALLGFAGAEAAKAAKAGAAGAHAARFVEVIALLLLPVSVLMCAYALFVFVWRSRAIARKQVGYIDDRYGPLGLAAVVVAALSAILLVSLIDLVHTLAPPPGPPPPPPPPASTRLAGALAAAVAAGPPAPPSLATSLAARAVSAEGFAVFNAAFNGVVG
jgi:SPX domain protein involved in polyphosphate accumulation/uncharacterized membrane protein YidH (DUF202 family)